MMMQEVDRVVARVRARENEQHDALSPVQTFVNAHMQVCVHCLCLLSALLGAPLLVCYARVLAAHLCVNAQQMHPLIWYRCWMFLEHMLHRQLACLACLSVTPCQHTCL